MLPYLLIELFYIGMPAVPTDGWAVGRSVGRSLYGHVITKFSRMGSLPLFLPMVLHCARFARESSAISTFCSFKWVHPVQYWPISISILILLQFKYTFGDNITRKNCETLCIIYLVYRDLTNGTFSD